MERLNKHTSYVAFSPDAHIVAGSDRKTIRIPDVTAGEAAMKASWHMLKLTHLFVNSPAGLVSNHVSLSPSDGWIQGPAGELIFWVLPEWRTYVVWPPCLSLIAEARVIVDAQYFVHGTDWTRCLASP
jgi:hypothetical protein